MKNAQRDRGTERERERERAGQGGREHKIGQDIYLDLQQAEAHVDKERPTGEQTHMARQIQKQKCQLVRDKPRELER